MIETLDLDKREYPYGFSVYTVKSEDSDILNRPARGNFYHMFYVKSGAITLQIDAHITHLTERECGFIGLNQVFKVTADTNFEIQVLRFDESFYCRHDIDTYFLNSCFFLDNTNGIIKLTLDDPTQTLLQQHYEALTEICIQSYNDLMFFIAHNTVERILLFSQKQLVNNAGERAKTVSPDAELMKNFRQLVKLHFKQEKQLQFYAEMLKTSTKRLTEACNNIYGHTPKKLITEQIILEAKRLLLHSPLNIKEIAFELKFEEPSNFIRFFFKSTEMTPKEYRDNSKDKIAEKKIQ